MLPSLGKKPCQWPRCPALTGSQHSHCSVHRPEAILERVKRIILKRFSNAGSKDLVTLQDEILKDMEQTV